MIQPDIVSWSLPKKEKNNLFLSKDRLLSKTLIEFDSKLSKFDFNKIIKQIEMSGVTIYWKTSVLHYLKNGYHHLIIIDNTDAHLVNLICEKSQFSCPSNVLFDIIKEE